MICNISSKLGLSSGFSAQHTLISFTHSSGHSAAIFGRTCWFPTANTIWNGGMPGYGSDRAKNSHSTMP